MARWLARDPKTSFAALVFVACAFVVPSACEAQVQSEKVAIEMDTEVGLIGILVDSVSAPVSAANFLRYVDAGLYDGGRFYRSVHSDNQPDDSVKITVIQGGMDRNRRDEGFDAVRMEGTNETGLRHLNGTVSMARAGAHTARSDFFVCIGDQPELDAGGRRHPDGLGFAAFGQVTYGMEAVRRINAMSTEDQYLTTTVQIYRVRRLERSRD